MTYLNMLWKSELDCLPHIPENKDLVLRYMLLTLKTVLLITAKLNNFKKSILTEN